MPEKESEWKFRAVQLDLARQMETMEYIRSFIDFISQYHYNKLFLYLEARIRTSCFPYPDPAQSYTPEQMQEIVTYASELGIEIIPIVPNLGHTDQFLQHPQLSAMAELRDKDEGRMGNSLDMVCPSLERTRSFFRDYYSEIARIFPSEYIHVGNDESWNLGCCSLCKKRAEEKGLSAVFSRHLLDTHRIIKGLGKKMMMWDDMFEVCPESLQSLPRDVVLCCWLYDDVSDKPRSHFFNQKREDLLAKYDRLGFSYLFCPREQTTANIISFSRYALKHNALGGLVTTWEHSNDFLYQYFPNIAFAGKLWTEADILNTEKVFPRTMIELFGIDDPLFISAMRTVANHRTWPELKRPENFLRGLPSQFEQERARETDLLSRVISPFREKTKSNLARQILEDILVALEREILQHRLRSLVPEIYERYCTSSLKKSDSLLNEVKQCLKGINVLIEKVKKEWDIFRPAIKPNHASKFFEDMGENFNTFMSAIEQEDTTERSILNLYCFLPDRYSSPRMKVSIRFKDSGGWKKICSGVFKPLFDEEPFYRVSFPLIGTKTPEAVLLEVWGYGGQGFRFIEIINSHFRYLPGTIVNTGGIVLNAEHLLYDDCRWSYLGEQDAFRTVHASKLKNAKHIIELSLEPEPIKNRVLIRD